MSEGDAYKLEFHARRVASEFNLIESEILHNGSIKTIHGRVVGAVQKETKKDSIAIQFSFSFRYKL